MSKFLRLFVFALLVASAGFFSAGCSRSTDCQDKNDNSSLVGNADPNSFSAGGSLIRELGEEPATLNPVIATDVYEGIVNGGIYETLIRRNNETLEFEPLLASSWKVSEDGLSYTFHLRKDVKWHDGTPFTADDVVFSYESIRNPKVAAAHLQSYYQDLKSYTKIDSHTVRCEYGKTLLPRF